MKVKFLKGVEDLIEIWELKFNLNRLEKLNPEIKFKNNFLLQFLTFKLSQQKKINFIPHKNSKLRLKCDDDAANVS